MSKVVCPEPGSQMTVGSTTCPEPGSQMTVGSVTFGPGSVVGSSIESGIILRSQPKINVRAEYHDTTADMVTYLDVLRVEQEDDNSFTAVVEHKFELPAQSDLTLVKKDLVDKLTRGVCLARDMWLEENNPRNGTDVVTPFDEFLY